LKIPRLNPEAGSRARAVLDDGDGIINGSILVLLILIPLIYPEALPKAPCRWLLDRAAAAAAAAPAAAAA
jgi:hypothetical protein